MFGKTISTLVLGAVFALSGCSTADTAAKASSVFQGDSLMSGLTSGLGLSETQAAGGLGSVMSLAGNKLPAADYVSLGKLLPNADKYIRVAQEAGRAQRSDYGCNEAELGDGQAGHQAGYGHQDARPARRLCRHGRRRFRKEHADGIAEVGAVMRFS